MGILRFFFTLMHGFLSWNTFSLAHSAREKTGAKKKILYRKISRIPEETMNIHRAHTGISLAMSQT